mmetsp:Transcript_28985/g.40403  ORF Transcript_28985/g.40403 Transcript_28985/m.40403 type:complete len:103 (+) Transcript_28985:134-442(+)
MAARARYRHTEDMEDHNNKLIGQLGNKVHSLKNLAIDIQSELQDQDKTLNDMQNPMANLGEMFKKTMSAMGQLSQGGGSWHMCYLILFVFIFFMLVKYLIMG